MTSGSHVNTPELSRREAVTGISTGPISIPGTSVLQLNLPESLQGVSLASPISPVTESSSATAPEAGTKADNNGRLYPCSYTENCETKSPLRKVVSHFFGRNKLATRKIPKHLWVYFCRKHYQRSRYRNPKGFASLQIDLVMSQIDNLKRWGGVQDWTVKVRRREEIRQTKFTTADPDDEDADIDEMEDACDEEAVEDVGEHSRRSSSATAASPRRRYSGVVGGSIPEHYLEFVGDHKSMDQVIALVEKIRNDMQSNGGTFPDLELLPNVAANIPGGEGEGDDDAEKTKGRKSKGKAKAVVNRKRKSANISDDQTLATLAIISGCASVVKSGNSSNEASEEHDDTANPGTGGSDNSHKRSRVHSLDFADIAKNGTDKSGHNQQTATPPPSAPAASRRTSLAVDPGFASPRNTNDMVLRGVDAALKSVRSDETGRSIETARTSITEDGPDFRVTRPEAFGASNPASGAPSSQCAPIAETRVEGRCEVKREGRDYISTVHQPNETILQRSSGQFRRPEGVFECITVGRR